MPSERAPRDDFLAAAEHIRKLMSITDEIDELIPCGWLSKEEAVLLRAIPTFLVLCVLNESSLVRTLRNTIESILIIFNDDRVAAVVRDDARITKAREILEQTAPPSDKQRLETAVGHINVLLDIILGIDEGEECKQLVLRHGEDIIDARDFVRSHARPDPPDEQPYTVVGFVTVDEFIDHLRKREEQPDNEGSDYGDEDEDWIVP